MHTSWARRVSVVVGSAVGLGLVLLSSVQVPRSAAAASRQGRRLLPWMYV